MLKPKGYETMDNEKSTMGLTTERKPGGLYRNVRISVKTADRLILVGIVVLIACVVFAISHAGFTVTFDTNGGSQIENQKVMHGQLVKTTPSKRAMYSPVGTATGTAQKHLISARIRSTKA